MSDMASPIVLTVDAGHSPETVEAADESRSQNRQWWTAAELNRFKQAWASGGLQAAVVACPGRSSAALYSKAKRLKLRLSGPVSRWRKPHVWTQQEDDLLLRKAKETGIVPGLWRDLAIELKLSRQCIRARAKVLGLGVARQRPLDWTPQEDAILTASRGLGIRSIRRKLREEGFIRSEPAIRVRINRLGGSRIERIPPGMLRSYELADLLGVKQATVNTWAREGSLPARRWGKNAHLIKLSDVRKFVVEHPAHIHLGKIEAVGARYWFIDLLAGGDK